MEQRDVRTRQKLGSLRNHKTLQASPCELTWTSTCTSRLRVRKSTSCTTCRPLWCSGCSWRRWPLHCHISKKIWHVVASKILDPLPVLGAACPCQVYQWTLCHGIGSISVASAYALPQLSGRRLCSQNFCPCRRRSIRQ